MLILTGKVGQRIEIGNRIAVIVSRVSLKQFTLGIEAPRDITIFRQELLDVDGFGNAPSVTAIRDPEAHQGCAGESTVC